MIVLQHETIEGYRQYFHGIVGFFVVEDHVMNTASSLVNRSYLDDVWNTAVSKIASSVRTHSVFYKNLVHLKKGKTNKLFNFFLVLLHWSKSYAENQESGHAVQ